MNLSADFPDEVLFLILRCVPDDINRRSVLATCSFLRNSGLFLTNRVKRKHIESCPLARLHSHLSVNLAGLFVIPPQILDLRLYITRFGVPGVTITPKSRLKKLTMNVDLPLPPVERLKGYLNLFESIPNELEELVLILTPNSQLPHIFGENRKIFDLVGGIGITVPQELKKLTIMQGNRKIEKEI